MININLLPYEMRPVKRTPLPYIFAIALLLAAVLYGMTLFFDLFREVNERRNAINVQSSELQALASTVEEFEGLTRQKEGLSYKIATIEEIIADRVVWSKQLEDIAKLTPKNIWYNRIRLVSKMDADWVPRQDRRTGEIILDDNGRPVLERVQVRKSFLELSGYVATDPELGERDINPLTDALESDPEFSNRYEIRNTTLEDAELPQFGRVRKFTLEYMITDQQG